MKSPRIMAPAAAVALAVMFGAVAFGQDGLLAGLVQPLVVNIEQQVPVDVTLAVPLEDGSVVTTTAPITVGIALQVKIDGVEVIEVKPAEATAPQVDVEAMVVPVEDGATLVSSNTPVSITIADVTLEVVDLRLEPLDQLPDDMVEDMNRYEAFEGVSVVGFLDVRVMNSTEQSIRLSPGSGAIVLGGEQVDLLPFSFFSGSDVNGLYYAEGGKTGQIVFALRQTTWDDIAEGMSAQYYVDAPSDEGYKDLSVEQYAFDLALAPGQ